MDRLAVALAILAGLFTSAGAAIIHVPEEQPTIQAGIDAASTGDIVLVACGTYYEHDIWMKTGVDLKSESGQADCVIVDAEGLGRVMCCDEVALGASVVGFTLLNGYTAYGGGGMYCCPFCNITISNCALHSNTTASTGGGLSVGVTSSVTIQSCTFEDNTAGAGGGGLNVSSATSATVVNCSFEGNAAEHGGGVSCGYSSSVALGGCRFLSNHASDRGGALSCEHDSQATMNYCMLLENEAGGGGGAISCTEGYEPSNVSLGSCTLSGNWAGVNGGGLFIDGSVSVSLNNTIIAFSAEGEGVHCTAGAAPPILSCCDVYGNSGGDWVGCIADQNGFDGNISADPLFCFESNPDEPYTLRENSPCAFGNSPGCTQIGARGVGCGPVTELEEAGWGAIKASYR